MYTLSIQDFSISLNLISIIAIIFLFVFVKRYKNIAGKMLTEEYLSSKKRGTRFVLREIAEFNKVSSPRKSRGYLLEELSSGLISKSKGKRWYRLEFNNVFLDGAHVDTVYRLCNSGLGKEKIIFQEITYFPDYGLSHRKNITPKSV